MIKERTMKKDHMHPVLRSSLWSLTLTVMLIASSGCGEEDASTTQPPTGDAAAAAEPSGAAPDRGQAPPGGATTVDAGAPVERDAQVPMDQASPRDDMSAVARIDMDPEPVTPRPGERVLGPTPESCETVSLIAPTLPAEAGHYAAKVLEPEGYPFAIESIRYLLVTDESVASCSGALAHRVLLFALDAEQPLPPTPSASGLGYREYEVPADPNAVAGRQVELSVPVPLILTEGQRAVVAVQLSAEAGQHLCIADCSDPGGTVGGNWWSNAAEPPFRWQDLVADFSLNSQLLIRVTGSSL